MAYQATDLSDEDKKKQDEAAGRPTSGVVDSSVPSGTGTGAGPAAVAPTPGTGFVNLQQYLDQNKGEGGRLASAATSDLSSKADAFKTQAADTVAGATQDFTKATGTDTAKALQSGLQTDATGTKSAASDFLGANYTGPTAGDLGAGLASKATDLQGSLAKVDDADTQAAALQDTYGKNGQTYTPGFGLLDRFLVGGTDSGRAAIGAVKAKAGDVATAQTTAAQQLADQEAASRAALAANQQSVRDTAAGTKSGIESAAQAKLGALNSQLNPAHVGASAGSLGDVLGAKDQTDLEALTALMHADPNSDWYKKTFNAGQEAPESVALPNIGGEMRSATNINNAPVISDVQKFAGSPSLNGGRKIQDDILGPIGPSNMHRIENLAAKETRKEAPHVSAPLPALVDHVTNTMPEVPKSLIPLSPVLKQGKKALKRWGL